jgi:PBSX family phage portal protein
MTEVIEIKPVPNKVRLIRFETGRDKNAIESQLIDVDPFDTIYTINSLIVPPFLTNRMQFIYEESDALQRNIAAYQNNIDGFGYHLLYKEEDRQRKSREAKRQKDNLEGFFDEPNEEGSFQTVRINTRRDFETYGYAFMEFTRFPLFKSIATCNYIPTIDMRLTKMDQDPILIEVPLFRDGENRKVQVWKRFRRFAQVIVGDTRVLRWFKTFGDPRTVDANTGEYVNHKPKREATEILYLRRRAGMKSYGIPRWTGNIPDVIGRSSAQYINYDLMDNQGIAPTIIIVQNGSLTDESKLELRKMVDSMRGVESFNRMALLEAVPELHGIDDKSNVTVEFKSMADYRREDLMFEKYLERTADDIRQSFRLPAIYVGQESQESYATGFAAQKIAEQQVFIPEREAFDEIINRRLIRQEFKCNLWKYQSKGPRISSSEELRLAMKEFSNSGAMTVNHAIQIANELLGLQMSTYREPWADLPVAFIKTQLNNGTMTIPEITTDPIVAAVVGQTPKPKEPGGRPETTGEPQLPEPPAGRSGQDERKKGDMIDE